MTHFKNLFFMVYSFEEGQHMAFSLPLRWMWGKEEVIFRLVTCSNAWIRVESTKDNPMKMVVKMRNRLSLPTKNGKFPSDGVPHPLFTKFHSPVFSQTTSMVEDLHLDVIKKNCNWLLWWEVLNIKKLRTSNRHTDRNVEQNWKSDRRW